MQAILLPVQLLPGGIQAAVCLHTESPRAYPLYTRELNRWVFPEIVSALRFKAPGLRILHSVSGKPYPWHCSVQGLPGYYCQRSGMSVFKTVLK